MPTTTIRVSTKTREAIHELAHIAGVSRQEIIDRALEVYRRQRILVETNAAYAILCANKEAWNGLEAERTLWDATLADGLEDE
ncbi:MAG: toxin-antitoxin system protein [Chloroflexi bacterium]|nr:toxin-antitoxin system protein [Chloroflexota bacterium]